MPLDPNAPEGMLRWIPECDTSPEAEEGWRQSFCSDVETRVETKRQLALPPDQRDPKWVKACEITAFLRGKPFINEEATLEDFGYTDYNDFSKKKTNKKGWLSRLFGG